MHDLWSMFVVLTHNLLTYYSAYIDSKYNFKDVKVWVMGQKLYTKHKQDILTGLTFTHLYVIKLQHNFQHESCIWNKHLSVTHHVYLLFKLVVFCVCVQYWLVTPFWLHLSNAMTDEQNAIAVITVWFTLKVNGVVSNCSMKLKKMWNEFLTLVS